MKSITIQSIPYIKGKIKIPGSKSISNRALLLSALSKGTTKLTNLLNSEDTNFMLKALKHIGIKYNLSKNKTTCIIQGNKKKFTNKKNKKIFTGNAGTVTRFLTAIFSIGKNDIKIFGNSRMNNRPIFHLIEALSKGGGKFKYLKKNGYTPIHIQGGFTGGNIKIKCNLSSQFLSAILMASPLLKTNTIIQIKGKIVSKSYICTTLKLMNIFGIYIKNYNFKYFYIKKKQKYISPKKISIEGDATSASYFIAASLINGQKIKILGLGKNSIQGEIKFCEIAKKMGGNINLFKNHIESKKSILNGININMNSIPDSAMTIAILALFAKGKTTIFNIAHWKIKESNRLISMTNEIKKTGAKIKYGHNFIKITPPKNIKHLTINTYNDHRIAMCFSLLALSKSPVTILNPKCVKKTYPNYFKDLNKLTN